VLDAEQVLPEQHRDAEGCRDRAGRRGDDTSAATALRVRISMIMKTASGPTPRRSSGRTWRHRTCPYRLPRRHPGRSWHRQEDIFRPPARLLPSRPARLRPSRDRSRE
jgi:hypothetical protein